jgi:hypothetical protein
MRLKIEEERRAIEHVCAFLKPYEQQYPGINFGQALEMEVAAIEASRPAADLKWQAGTITLRLSQGKTMSMPAELLGPLAVHLKHLGGPVVHDSIYTLTHVPTSRIIYSGLRSAAKTKQLAEKLAYLDWNFSTLDVPPATASAAWVIIQAFRFLKGSQKRGARKRVN